MNMVKIIQKKKDGEALSRAEIDWFIEGYTKGDIPDYQASALLMSIYFQGVSKEEIFYLTEAMRYSGDTIDLSPIEGIKVDKHSTGGVGDKTSLVVAPIVASLGLTVAKMSGRGLGHTGGTVDKLEAIPGFCTDLAVSEFERIVNEKIREDILNNTYENVPIEEAKNMGAMALFGEKYGDHVRVVAFDKDYSVELCGGTHIASTGRIGSFKILSEGAIAAGVRRIEAVTGEEVMNYLDHQIEQISKIKEIVKTSGDLIKAIENLNAQNQTLQKKVEQMMHDKAVAEARSIYNTAVDYEGRKLIVAKVEADVNQMRTIATSVKELDAEAILIMGGIFEAKPALCVMIPQSLVDERKWDAGAMIREAAKEIQGGGGGLTMVIGDGDRQGIVGTGFQRRLHGNMDGLAASLVCPHGGVTAYLDDGCGIGGLKDAAVIGVQLPAHLKPRDGGAERRLGVVQTQITDVQHRRGPFFDKMYTVNGCLWGYAWRNLLTRRFLQTTSKNL